MSREANLARLRDEHWDVLVIGGGINGAGIARDLVLRDAGLRVALVEKNHFASGTSSRNSQLIHGGLRYLKYLDFHLVREALRERATLLAMSGGLVEPLKFIIPCEGLMDRLFYGAGLALYDLLAGRYRNWQTSSRFAARSSLLRLQGKFRAAGAGKRHRRRNARRGSRELRRSEGRGQTDRRLSTRSRANNFPFVRARWWTPPAHGPTARNCVSSAGLISFSREYGRGTKQSRFSTRKAASSF